MRFDTSRCWLLISATFAFQCQDLLVLEATLETAMLAPKAAKICYSLLCGLDLGPWIQGAMFMGLIGRLGRTVVIRRRLENAFAGSS